MLTISKPLSAGQARRYHAEEFQNARENYYAESERMFHMAIETAPWNTMGYNNLAGVYLYDKRFRAAVDLLKTANRLRATATGSAVRRRASARFFKRHSPRRLADPSQERPPRSLPKRRPESNTPSKNQSTSGPFPTRRRCRSSNACGWRRTLGSTGSS